MYRLASATVEVDGGYSLDAAYTYEDDLLTSIETNSTTYHFTYGDFSLISSISVGTRTLASYTYTDDHELKTLTYGNGDSVSYTYDDYGRVIAETFEDGDTVTYAYDNTGALATVTDSATGRKTTYYYDFTNRLMKYVESGDGYSHSVGYDYDTLNNLTLLVETINGVEHTTSYTYDDDNRVSSVTAGDTSRTYSYDTFGRLSSYVTAHNGTEILTETLSYDNAGRVSDYLLEFPSRGMCYTYTYDDNGNITAIYEAAGSSKSILIPGTGNYCIVQYTYDSANQLIGETNYNGGPSHTWTYDDAGNITSRTTSGTTVTYTYENSNWGDLLTSYNGNTITYDGIGNPLSDGTWTYAWEHGRELAAMSDGTTTWNYTYDANGMRTSRSNGTTTYTYIYNGSQLMQMTVGDTVMDFTYDAAGRPMTMTYNGETYYYAVNPQGDVLAILDSAGILRVYYSYDAWGNIVSTGGSMATTLGQTNPLRYRGYVYDQETALYYLQSRYYNPGWGRFINADSFVSTGQGILGNNMFAYCCNNPVMRTDHSGAFWEELWTEFTQTIQEASGYFAAALGIAQLDSPVPGPADLVGAAMVASGVVVCMGLAINTLLFAEPPTFTQDEDQVVEYAPAYDTPDQLIVFPADPNDFNPVGLIKIPRPGTKNGMFISWMDPITKKEVFRWDENPNYYNGPHYHIYGTGHYYPGSIVPEPYATIYFPFGQ